MVAGLLRSFLVFPLFLVGFTAAQDAAKDAAKPAAKKAAAAIGDEALATVNGEAIPKSEVINWLGRFEIVPGSEQRAYEAALDTLIDGKLLEQFMQRTRKPVSKADLDRYVQRFTQSLQQEGTSLENYLATTSTTPEQFNKMAVTAAQWENYVVAEGRDAILKKYLQDNMDIFSRAEVKASHILLEVDPKASAEDKEKVRQRLLAIKKEITDGKITFADAANKYSEDKGNKAQPQGGNLGYFPRKGVFIEPFSKAAFAMKEGEMSDPIETEYGMHLILVTGRKPGETVVFSEEVKPFVLSVFAEELQTRLIENERKSAKIEIKPMPADLLRLIPKVTEEPAAQPAAAKAETKDAAKKKN